MSDPRDVGSRGAKEWEEFRATFASALLFVWLVKDLPKLAPEYPFELWNRLQTSRDIHEQILAGDPEDDGARPIPGPGPDILDPDSLEWWDGEAADLLEVQLFPHGYDEVEFYGDAAGLALVALHSAPDSYCSSVCPPARGGLSNRMSRAVSAQGGLSAETARWIDELEATRNVVVHNRGVVDERYVRRSHDPTYLIGEFRRVTSAELQRFAEAVWQGAVSLRGAEERPG